MHAIGTQLRDPINSGTDPMAYGGLTKLMNAAAEIRMKHMSKHQIQPEYRQ